MILTQFLVALIIFGAMVYAAPTNLRERRPVGKFNLGLEGNLDLEGDLNLFGNHLIDSAFSEFNVAPAAPVPAVPAPVPAPAPISLAANDLRNPSGDSVIVVVDAKNH